MIIQPGTPTAYWRVAYTPSAFAPAWHTDSLSLVEIEHLLAAWGWGWQ